MKFTKPFLATLLLISTLSATDYTITKSAPFNPLLSNGYESCEANATKMIEQKAINEYFGCSVYLMKYDIHVKQQFLGNRSITQNECKIEATYSVSSKYLDANDYLKGSFGAICLGYDTTLTEDDTFWYSFELGVFMGTTGSQNSLEMRSSNSKIYYDYDAIPLYGLIASYEYKLFSSQYIGAKVLFATSFETYQNTSVTSSNISRNDGNPSIKRFGAGVYYGYRYHIKTELSTGLNYTNDSITRTYINNTYNANVSGVNAELGIGYYILPYLKIWGSVTSDTSMNAGVSWVW
jgi:hypothetical protein